MNDSSQIKSFPSTLWTVVLRAGQDDATEARSALSQLCEAYWYPLYSFIRRRGHAPHDAEDLTQAFFSHVLDKHALGGVGPEGGRFRTFLLASLKNFLANEWDKTNALKRGGGRSIASLDSSSAESRYQLEPSHDMTPERHFERQWALTLLERVLAELRAEYQAAGNGDLFEAIQGTLGGDSRPYSEIADHLGRSEGAIKIAVHRLKRRYRELMVEQISSTVGENEAEEELRHLLAALSA